MLPLSVSPADPLRRPLPPDFVPLTGAQLAALQLLAHGYWPSHFASLLGVPPAMATALIGAAAQSLGARTPEHAVAEALRRGLIT